MKHPLRTPLMIILLLAMIGGGAAFFLARSEDAAAPAGQSYATAPVVRGDLERTVSSTGTLAAVETVEVGTEVSGTIARVDVDYNDQVRKGQILAELKQDLFRAAVVEAEAAVARAKADLALAGRELQRNRPLFEQHYISELEFLPFEINLDKAKAALDSAEASRSRAQTNLANTVIRSPIAGTVIQRSIDAGQTVAASLNTPTLFIIARDLTRMQIEADVDETDIGQIREGQQVRFSVQSYPERSFTGRVRQVRLQPEVVSNVVTYTVIVDADNRERQLLPGMTATVDFIVEQAQNVLLVPNAALRFKPSPPPENGVSRLPGATAPTPAGPRPTGRVFVLDAQGALQPVRVTTAGSDGQRTIIAAGDLQEGTPVVTGSGQNGELPKQNFSLFGAMRGKRK